MGVGMKLLERVMHRDNPVQFPHTFLSNDGVSVLMFVLLAGSLYYFARKPLKDRE